MLQLVLSVLHDLIGAASPSAPLMEMGIDSLSVTGFVQELRQQTGLNLSPTLIFEHSTAEAVAKHLSQLAAGAETCGLCCDGGARLVSMRGHTLISKTAGRWPD